MLAKVLAKVLAKERAKVQAPTPAACPVSPWMYAVSRARSGSQSRAPGTELSTKFRKVFTIFGAMLADWGLPIV